MYFKPKDLKMPQILNISEKLTLLVGFDTKSRGVVVAIGTGDFEDFKMKGHIALPVEAARRLPTFLQDFLTSWDTSLASEHIRRIMEMEEVTKVMGGESALTKRRESSVREDTYFEERCEICGKKVDTEIAIGWFKLYRGERVIWICPDHDAREAFLFVEKKKESL